jgi:hypothetical protein
MNTQIPAKLLEEVSTALKVDQSYKVGDIIIPSDIKLFNKMWLDKDFDKIDPALFKPKHRGTMYRGDNRMHTWENTFFTRRQDLTYRSAIDIWENSTYYLYFTLEVNKILHTSHPLENALLNHDFTKEMVKNYLSLTPLALMFPENKAVVYTNRKLLLIYRDLIARFQLIGNKTNDERTSIYLSELYSVSKKIQFIQTLSYYGLDATICRFKNFKNNYLVNDPEIRDIRCLWETGYKEALYKFYTFCISSEILSKEITDKARDLGTIVIHHEDIQRLVSCYLLPLMSSIKQDKLKTICCQEVLSYLRPSCITEQYIVAKLVFV